MPPKINKLTIVTGGSLPSATINGDDSVFWFNNTAQNHQPQYKPPAGPAVNWGVPPSPLPPQKSSSQVVFPNPTKGKKGAKQVFNYTCSVAGHGAEKGTITVVKT